MTTGEALAYGRKTLAGAGDAPARDASLLLAHVLGSSPEYAYLHPEASVSDSSFERYKALIERRKAGEPVAYLRGIHEFMGFSFKVDRRVLVPRPETEFVVETVLRLLSSAGPLNGTVSRAPDTPPPQPTFSAQGRNVADICCGSGAIGLSIAKLLPGVSVVLTDVSREAVDLARENADRLGVGEAATFLSGDLVEPLLAAGLAGRLDVVAANPPYIPHDEMGSLPRDVRDYEPHLALDGGPLGLEVIARIALEVPAVLKPGGYLVMEIGSDQGEASSRIFRSTGLWQGTSVANDYAGRQRVVVSRTRSAG